VLEDLEMLRRQGVGFDASMFGVAPGAQRYQGKAGNGSTASRATSTRSTASRDQAPSRSNTGSKGSSRSGSSSRSSASRSSQGPWTSSSRQYSKRLPRFDELTAEELYELLTSKTDPRTAKAARAWVQQALTAKRMHPGIAGNLAFLLAMDYITEDLDDQDPRDWVFGEMFDPDSERYKGRARAGSAYDYVKYSSDGSDADDSDDDHSTAWLDVDMILENSFMYVYDCDSDSD